jgi:hypothetical protein
MSDEDEDLGESKGLRLLALVGNYAEVWTDGVTVYEVPVIFDAAPEDVKVALGAVRDAIFAGHCECGSMPAVRTRRRLSRAVAQGLDRTGDDRVIAPLPPRLTESEIPRFRPGRNRPAP